MSIVVQRKQSIFFLNDTELNKKKQCPHKQNSTLKQQNMLSASSTVDHCESTMKNNLRKQNKRKHNKATSIQKIVKVK